MVVIAKGILNKFIVENPPAEGPLLKWYQEVKAADWSDFSELKRLFSTADYVGDGLYVFNVGGNKYRLVARIVFRVRTIFIRFIGTHKQYDKVKFSDL